MEFLGQLLSHLHLLSWKYSSLFVPQHHAKIPLIRSDFLMILPIRLWDFKNMNNFILDWYMFKIYPDKMLIPKAIWRGRLFIFHFTFQVSYAKLQNLPEFRRHTWVGKKYPAPFHFPYFSAYAEVIFINSKVLLFNMYYFTNETLYSFFSLKYRNHCYCVKLQ